MRSLFRNVVLFFPWIIGETKDQMPDAVGTIPQIKVYQEKMCDDDDDGHVNQNMSQTTNVVISTKNSCEGWKCR